MLFEVKHAKKDETIEHALQAAIDQIEEKHYLESVDEFETVVCYGIAFKRKKFINYNEIIGCVLFAIYCCLCYNTKIVE